MGRERGADRGGQAEQGTAGMARLCRQQLHAAIPPRGPGSGWGLPGSPLLLLLFLLASSVRVCKGEERLPAAPSLQIWGAER